MAMEAMSERRNNDCEFAVGARRDAAAATAAEEAAK